MTNKIVEVTEALNMNLVKRLIWIGQRRFPLRTLGYITPCHQTMQGFIKVEVAD